MACPATYQRLAKRPKKYVRSRMIERFPTLLLMDSSMSSVDPEQFRDYLRLLGTTQLDRRLASKVDVSGVIQVTMLEVHEQISTWESLPDERRLAWLRRVFANNLQDEIRKFRGKKRDALREFSLDAAIDESASRIDAWIAGEQSSPSKRVASKEQVLLLADALATLPPPQCEAMTLHYFRGLTLKEVAEQMEKTEGAVAALIFRGTRSLRQRFDGRE